MTPLQITMIVDLHRCTFLPESFEKRFVKSLFYRASHDPNKPITDRQNRYLAELYHKYRKQIGARQHNINCVLCNRELDRQEQARQAAEAQTITDWLGEE
jgi:hypothetical protein